MLHSGIAHAECVILLARQVQLEDICPIRNPEIKGSSDDKELADLNAKVTKTQDNQENDIRTAWTGYEIMEEQTVESKRLLAQIRRIGNDTNHLLF